MSDGSTPAEAPDPVDMAAAMAAAQAAAEAEAAAQAKAEADALAASLAALAAANAQAAPTLFHDDTVPAPHNSFGPTFAAELAAAGVAGLAYAYGPASISFAPTISAKDRARVMAVVAAHDPAAPGPLPPLPDLSDRQFGEGLWREGLISFDDYLAFIGPGTVPPPLLAIINTLPDDDTGAPTPRKTALGLVTGAQTYEFANPLVELVRQKLEWTVDKLRDRWATWATL